MSRCAPYAILALVLMIFLSGADNAALFRAEEYYKNGKAKYHSGDYAGSIEEYNKAIELTPNIAKIFGSRGAAKRKLGDKKGAIADARTAARLGDKDAQRILRILGYGW